MVLHARVVSGAGGGPEKTILNSPRFLTELGYRSVCAYMHPPDDVDFMILEERAADAGATLASIPDQGLKDLSVIRKLLKLCREQQVDIWHGHDYKSNVLGVILSQFHRMKLITTVHGWVKFTSRTPFYYWVDRQSLKWYDEVICVSEDLRETCIQSGVSSDRCHLIHNAIDIEQNCRRLATSEAKQNFGWSSDEIVIGAVGRLSAEKGFDLLIQAVGELIDAGHPLRLVIAGEGDARDSLAQLINQQSEPDRFQLLGHRNDIPDLMQAMDMFALSSYREGLPNVVLEAMAFEVPVVSTKVAGIPRLIQHNENGVLVDAGNETELREALSRLIEQPALREKLSIAGRQTIEQEFSFQSRMEQVAALYDRLLSPNSQN
ncbi:MAG: glycosyltransferase family 4 protein [Planctomycetaceae bacterium]|nr:glycosyltransferase family 4 protein [Planctomycetaceae bacterium]